MHPIPFSHLMRRTTSCYGLGCQKTARNRQTVSVEAIAIRSNARRYDSDRVDVVSQ